VLNVLILAAEEHEEFSPIKPVWEELAWAAVFFIVLFVIISKVALPKLNAALAAREQAITGSMTAAEQSKTDADALLADYRAKLADAQAEAGRIIDEGRRTAEGIVAEARSRAEAEAQTLVTRAQSDIQAERDRAIQVLRSELGTISIEVASKVVGRSLDNEAQRSLVDSYIDELSATRQN
jgi:F-type H+-transporting ATPase subunit b